MQDLIIHFHDMLIDLLQAREPMKPLDLIAKREKNLAEEVWLQIGTVLILNLYARNVQVIAKLQNVFEFASGCGGQHEHLDDLRVGVITLRLVRLVWFRRRSY